MASRDEGQVNLDGISWHVVACRGMSWLSCQDSAFCPCQLGSARTPSTALHLNRGWASKGSNSQLSIDVGFFHAR